MDKMRPRRHRGLAFLRGDQRGGAIIEAAIVLPLFLILVLGTMGWSYFLLRQIVLQYAVEYSSRCLIIPLINAQMSPLCGDYKSYGVSNGLGIVVDPNTFSTTSTLTSQYTLSCVRGQTTNPLGFLQYLTLPVGGNSLRLMIPSTSRASFCRVDPMK